MNTMVNEPKKAKTYKANLMLKQKIGSGPLDEKIVKQAQKAIDENKVDFTPLGMEFLDLLQKNLNKVKDNLGAEDVIAQKQLLTQPVMELKANATIFHYSLIGNLANIMLSFLESIEELDDDAIAIVQAHHTTLQAIVVKKMTGDGGTNGEVFMKELKQVCARYYSKRKVEKKD
ncbi:MAG: hypothetical protein CMH31_06465 [Micavibrio sp.]|nr:hypothetical protein [Micavibrio sp.]|tara:strand:+ start:113 stop:634 length:522 start_codon:yes stop_codon:yes gene_type:complete